MRKHSRKPLACLMGLATLVANALPQPNADAQQPLDMVSILQGTDSVYRYSHGNTLPLLGSPWAMTNWTVQSNRGDGDRGDRWYFNPNDKAFAGFRATHQPSPWMGDWGQFAVMPQTGDVKVTVDDRKSSYDPAKAVYRADYIKVELDDYNVTAEATATTRCAVMRFTYNDANTGRLIFDPGPGGHVEVDGNVVRGYCTFGAGEGAPQGFQGKFVFHLDRDITATGTFDGNNVKAGESSITGRHVGAYVEFEIGDDKVVDVVAGNSFISYDQADLNIEQEVKADFDATRSSVAAEWNKSLSRIEVEGGTQEQRETFYSCLYRAHTFPHRLHEIDADGKTVHYGFYTDGTVTDGVLYGDNGFWDVYRTNYSFWAMVYPEQLAEMLEGFTNAYKESGWYPQWPAPGHRGGMIGSHIDAIIADAVVKNIKGFDLEAAYEGIRRNAFEKAPSGMGRPGFEYYSTIGYVPDGKTGYSVSATLDYAYDDWCVAQVAKALGKHEDYQFLMKRTRHYRNVWDPKTKFFRPKDENGKFIEPFDPYAWGGAYVEGGPWQCSWAVQHDPEGLARLLGGTEGVTARLDQFFGLPPVYQHGHYGGEIHEMTEMGHINFGQLAQGNQPVHHVPYFYIEYDQAYKTNYWVRRALTELYNAGPQGFPGDEDNGEQGAWYCMSAIGMFPFCVGDPNYSLTSPLFDKVTMHLGNGKTFTVRTENNGPFNYYTHERTLNGEKLEGHKMSHDTFMEGGELVVKLSHLPPAGSRP